MSFINIRRSNTDIFYRYKMPPIQSKTEGRGNGIKTAILNLSDVAKALARPPSYIVKYFGFELGAQTIMNEENERYLVNGEHSASKLQDTLDGFINKFVLCQSCENPETDLIVKKGDLYQECKACGKVNAVDPRLKLTSYILKNPPKKIVKGTAAANVGGSSISDLVDGKSGEKAVEDDEKDIDEIENEAKKLLTKKVTMKDDDWSVDMSAEAIAERAKALALSEAQELSKYDEFGEWMLGFGKDKSKLPSDIDIFKKLKDLGIENDEATVAVLAQTLFDENIVSDKQIGKHEQFLEKIISTPEHEKNFLGGIERFLGLEHPDLIKLLPKILYELYDLELVSEEAIQKFGTTVSKKFVGDKKLSKKVRKAAKPFLTWLENAEEESDEE